MSALPFPRYYLDFETIGAGRADLRGHAAVRGAAVSMVVPHREEPRRGRARRVPRPRRRSRRCAGSPRACSRRSARRGRSSSTRRTSGACCTSSRRATAISPRALAALAERIVDLHPPTRRHYYHPADARLVVDQGRAADGRARLRATTRSATSGTGSRRRRRTSRRSTPKTPRRAPRRAAPRVARLLPARHARARAARGVLRPLGARLTR